MNKTRKVIGVCDQLVSNKTGIAFPLVRVWLRGANDYETWDLEQLFPERGTVYLHASACENQHLQMHQIGLFNCVESPGQSAAWKVTSTSRHLAKVIDYPNWSENPDQLALWKWLNCFKDSEPCNILLSQGIVYVRRGKRELIGPFSASLEGKLVSREQTLLFEGLETISIDVGAREYCLIDTELLPKGKPIVLDPTEAIHRRLKHVYKTSHLDWLSRSKTQELSAALAGAIVDDGSEWVMANLPHALEVVVSSGNLDEKIAEDILQLKTLENALEVAWKRKHVEAVKKSEQEITGLRTLADGIKRTVKELTQENEKLEGEKGSLENILLELRRNIEAVKIESQQVFDAEMKKLAQSPATMALLGAWVSGSKKPTDRGQPLIRIQYPSPAPLQVPDLRTALFNNLKACSLSPIIATELSMVCSAALAAGQPIALRSLFADLLAGAIASALGQPVTVWADVPAGLLDPVDWEGLIPSDRMDNPIILQNANRSDIPLVLGTFRSAILEQALGIRRLGCVILLTLEMNAEIQVASDYPLGPLIDERLLRFNPGKAVNGVCAFPDFAMKLPEVSAVSADDFAEIGNTVVKLPLFAASAQESVFRRAYGALCSVCENQQQAARLFFKYWCLARCSQEDVLAVLEEHKNAWAQDKSLGELKAVLERNE